MIEYRLKQDQTQTPDPWKTFPTDVLFENINWDYYSLRINESHIYHKRNAKGLKEEFKKAILWMKLAGLKGYGDLW